MYNLCSLTAKRKSSFLALAKRPFTVFGNFHEGFIFVKLCIQSFMKIKPSQNGKITLSFTDICKSYLSCEILTSQKCLNATRENKILPKKSEFPESCQEKNIKEHNIAAAYSCDKDCIDPKYNILRFGCVYIK